MKIGQVRHSEEPRYDSRVTPNGGDVYLGFNQKNTNARGFGRRKVVRDFNTVNIFFLLFFLPLPFPPPLSSSSPNRYLSLSLSLNQGNNVFKLSMASAVRDLGNAISNVTCKSPNWEGTSCWGIPSPL